MVEFPEAAALATATPDGRPSVRMVLAKGFDERGFKFHTGRGSRKARSWARPERVRSSSTGIRSAGKCGSRAASSVCPTRSPRSTSGRGPAAARLLPGPRLRAR